MRVVSFNIHHGTIGRNGPVDPRRLGEVCAAFEADVIALQEVDQGTIRTRGKDLAAIAGEVAGMAHVFGSSQRMLGGRYGNALLVRGEIRSSTVTRLPKVPRSRFWQEQRTVLGAEVVIDGVRLSVAGTHLAVKAWNNGPQLDALLAATDRMPAPRVLLGDFNRKLDDVEPFAARAGWETVAHGPTFPAGAPRLDIDHVLHSLDLRVTAVEVRSTEMSDHAALVVDLERTR